MSNTTNVFSEHQCRSLVPHLLPKLNVTARHWIVLRKENRGGGGGGGWGGGGLERLSVP